ncbi:type IV pilin protein [Candidatus Avelusimicrobium sp.]
MKNVFNVVFKLLKDKVNSHCLKDKTREDAEQKPLSMTPCFGKGFTLIELLVVVLIIGILSAVALPQYRKAVLKSKLTQAMVVLNAWEKAQTIYYLENGYYATDLDELSIGMGEKKGKLSCSGSGGVNYCNILVADGLGLEWVLEWPIPEQKHRCVGTPGVNSAVCASFGGVKFREEGFDYWTLP